MPGEYSVKAVIECVSILIVWKTVMSHLKIEVHKAENSEHM